MYESVEFLFYVFLFNTLHVLRGNSAFYAELSLRDFNGLNGLKCIIECLWSNGMKDEEIIILTHKTVNCIRAVFKCI